MEKLKTNAYYPVILICLVILVIAGCYGIYNMYYHPENHLNNLTHDNRHLPPPGTPAFLVPGSTPVPIPMCDQLVTNSRIPVPENLSVAIRDPMPGIRYSIHENASEKTIVLEKGDLVEINLGWTPGLAYYWIVPVTGCGLEVVQAGTYADGGDFWNNTGHYRIRYRAITSGTSQINGRFGLHPAEESNPEIFNLTVNVK
jgi:hypothetical protein